MPVNKLIDLTYPSYNFISSYKIYIQTVCSNKLLFYGTLVLLIWLQLISFSYHCTKVSVLAITFILTFLLLPSQATFSLQSFSLDKLPKISDFISGHLSTDRHAVYVYYYIFNHLMLVVNTSI